MRDLKLTEEEHRHLLGFLEMMLNDQSYLGYKYVSEATANGQWTQCINLDMVRNKLRQAEKP
jgi:hypothetical protein